MVPLQKNFRKSTKEDHDERRPCNSCRPLDGDNNYRCGPDIPAQAVLRRSSIGAPVGKTPQAYAVIVLSLVILLGVFAGPATAQSENYPVEDTNFDLWCQEQAHLSPQRCDRRTADDERAFEDFQRQIDPYEIPYLRRKQAEFEFQRDVLENDPIDNPVTQDPQALMQDPNLEPRLPPP
jgi:hypothetical protein